MHHGHENGHSANTCPCCMFMSVSMPHVQVHAVCPSPFSRSKYTLHVGFHSACPCTYNVSFPFSMSMLIRHVYVCVLVNSACPCPCCIRKSLLKVHAACSSPCSMFMSMLHGYVDIKYGHGNAGWPFSTDRGMQHGHGHTACTVTCCIDMKMQQRHGHTV
jgi:hypothetical protein